jgi:hypothetical protein
MVKPVGMAEMIGWIVAAIQSLYLIGLIRICNPGSTGTMNYDLISSLEVSDKTHEIETLPLVLLR